MNMAPINHDEPVTTRVGKTQGQFVVGAMLAVAVLMATFAWWWNYNRGIHALNFYGANGAILAAPYLFWTKGEKLAQTCTIC